MFAREEKVLTFSFQLTESVKSPDGRVLGSNRKMRDAFRTYFRDHFVCCPDLQVQEFRSYLADFPRLREAEATSCEGLVTESPGLNGLLYEIYLMLPRMFLPILTDVFNHWFTHGAIPGNVTKGVITFIAEERWPACIGGTRQLQPHNSGKHRVKEFGPGLSKMFSVCHLRFDRTWAKSTLWRED